MISSQIQQALVRIKALQSVLAEAPESWDHRTAPGKQIQRRTAEEEINTIMDGFKKLVSAEIAKIFVVGSDKKKLAEAKLIASEMGAVVVEADALYKRLAAPAVPLYEQWHKFTVDVCLTLENDIMTACQMNNITPNDFPRVTGNFLDSVLLDPETQIQDIARQTVERVCGTELQQALLTQLIFSEAMRLENDEVPVPVVVVGIRDNEVTQFETRSFFPGRPTVSVNVDGVKSVEGSLKAAAKKVLKMLQPNVENVDEATV